MFNLTNSNSCLEGYSMGYRIGFAGSVGLRDKPETWKWRKVAKALGSELGSRGHTFISGGCAGGLTEDVAIGIRNFLLSKELDHLITYRIISYLYEKYPYHSVDFGQSIVCIGLDKQKRREFLASQIDIMIAISGGEGTKAECKACDKLKTPILPVGFAEGSSGEKWLEICRAKPANYYNGVINDEEFNFLNQPIDIESDIEVDYFIKRLVDFAEKIVYFKREYPINKYSETENNGSILESALKLDSEKKEQSEETKVFISCSGKDILIANQIYTDLQQKGLIPWVVHKDIDAGEKIEFAVRREIKDSDYFIALLSSSSVNERGMFQKELRMAFDILDELHDSDIFVIPVRLEECNPANEKLDELYIIDLHKNGYNSGLEKIIQVLQQK